MKGKRTKKQTQAEQGYTGITVTVHPRLLAEIDAQALTNERKRADEMRVLLRAGISGKRKGGAA